MMSPLKFRVWHKQSKRMHYDGFKLDPSGSIEALDERCWGENVIMQSTGLTDKNGKEIFEGDIVQWPNTVRGHPAPSETAILLPPEIVAWSEQWERGGSWAPNHIGYHDIDSKCEVIGNIYENPDLLPANRREFLRRSTPYLLAILGLLVGIELVRRTGETLNCYYSNRTWAFLAHRTGEDLWAYCRCAVLEWPFCSP